MRIMSFGFEKGPAPAEATLVLDARPLADVTGPEAKALLAEARRNASPDAVIAFGDAFGEFRSVTLANKFAEEMAAAGKAVRVDHVVKGLGWNL